MIPNDLLFDKLVPATAKALYVVLAHHANWNRKGICFVGLRKLKEQLNLGSTNTVKKLTTILEEEGWISIMKNYFGRCSGYKVHFKKRDGFIKNCNIENSAIDTEPSHGMRSINTNNKEIKDYQEDEKWTDEL
jgi:SOS-response transcriptional repressor LexA